MSFTAAFVFVMIFKFPVQVFASNDLTPVARASAAGCGSKTFTDETETASGEVDEMAKCYQKAIEENFRNHLTPVGMAFEICSQFEIDVRQYYCLKNFKDSAKDPQLYKLFGECTSSEKDIQKKVSETHECVKKNKAQYQTKFEDESELTKRNADYLNFVRQTCGNQSSIAVTISREVSDLADCYQQGLLRSFQKPASKASLSLELCEKFDANLNKMNCLQRAKTSANDPKIDYAFKLCDKSDDKFRKKREGESGWDYSDKKLALRWECVRDEFQRVTVDPDFKVPESKAKNKAAP